MYDNLKWAQEAKRALGNGLDEILRDLQAHRSEIEGLPDTGVPGELRQEVAPELEALAERLASEEFFKHANDLQSALTHLKARVRGAAEKVSERQRARIEAAAEELEKNPGWGELSQTERAGAVAQLEALAIEVSLDLDGLRKLLTRDYDIGSTVEDLKRSIQRQGQERLRARLEEEGKTGPSTLSRTVKVPAKARSAADLDSVIKTLNEIKAQMGFYAEVDVRFTVEEGGS